MINYIELVRSIGQPQRAFTENNILCEAFFIIDNRKSNE